MCGGPSGSSGIIVKLSTNHFRLTSRPQWALYQYHIDYNPLMEARRLRSALLFQHEDLIGRCHAFDGTILFLPKRLQHKVISNVSTGRGELKGPTPKQSSERVSWEGKLGSQRSFLTHVVLRVPKRQKDLCESCVKSLSYSANFLVSVHTSVCFERLVLVQRPQEPGHAVLQRGEIWVLPLSL